jgi:hypothetical protein
MLGKDGLHRWFLFRYNPLRDRDGRVLRWFVTGTEIESRKQAEARVQNENLALRTIRFRDGAVFWGLFSDAVNPARYAEHFLVESWFEHLRQHGRVTGEDSPAFE